MKILITGAKGQLGYKIKELLACEHKSILTDRAEMDIADLKTVESVILETRPDFVIHTAAYTKVDQAEAEVDLCRKINIVGTKNIAWVCQKIGASLIYISTDYVFDGQKKSPYLESDKANPLNVYGQTKFEGEKIVATFVKNYYIIRTAWLFGESDPENPRPNFVQTMLQLASEKSVLKVVSDQIGSPTYTKDLTEAISQILIQKPVAGIYHFSGEGECSWYDFAKEIFRLKSIDINLQPIASADYPQKAHRPRYSYLSKEKIQKELSVKVRNWRQMLSDYIND